jgi:hypothetical protein
MESLFVSYGPHIGAIFTISDGTPLNQITTVSGEFSDESFFIIVDVQRVFVH